MSVLRVFLKAEQAYFCEGGMGEGRLGGDSPATELGRGMRYKGMEWAECEDMLSRLRSGILLRLYVDAVMFSSTRYRKESMPDFCDCHSFRLPREPSVPPPPCLLPQRSMFSE